MTKEEYFFKSKTEGLSTRCPILSLCERRALTIYFFSEYYKIDSENNVIKTLQREGELPANFNEIKVDIQGELPVWSKSENLFYYHNMCPEVNLFDTSHSLLGSAKIASSDGEWDNFRSDTKFENCKSKHFSECPEFSKYLFDKKGITLKKEPAKKEKLRRIGISSKLRFEIFSRDKFTCVYCGRNKDEDKVKLELDHKLAISNGGKDDYENLITSCRDCNQGKSNKII
jgi:hypothetical protein